MKKPAKYLFILLAFALVFFGTVAAVTQMAKTSALNGIYEDTVRKSKIVSVEYIRYESEPFMSVVLEKRITDNQSSPAFKTIKNMKSMKISPMFNPKESSEILIVRFKNGKKLNCYLKGSKLGIDNGKVWVKGVRKKDMLKTMKKPPFFSAYGDLFFEKKRSDVV